MPRKARSARSTCANAVGRSTTDTTDSSRQPASTKNREGTERAEILTRQSPTQNSKPKASSQRGPTGIRSLPNRPAIAVSQPVCIPPPPGLGFERSDHAPSHSPLPNSQAKHNKVPVYPHTSTQKKYLPVPSIDPDHDSQYTQLSYTQGAHFNTQRTWSNLDSRSSVRATESDFLKDISSLSSSTAPSSGDTSACLAVGSAQPEGLSHDAPRQQGKLDRYADSYIPRWLQAVNIDPNFTRHSFSQSPPLDYKGLASAFLPNTMLESDAFDELQESSSSSPIALQISDVSEQLTPVDPTWLGGTCSFIDEPLEGTKDEEDTPSMESVQASGSDSKLPSDSSKTESTTHTSALPLSTDDSKGGKFTQFSVDTRSQRHVPELSPATYSDRLTILLLAELEFRAIEKASQALYNAKISVYAGRKTPVRKPWSEEGLYSLSLPGVREDFPLLLPGDLIELRTLASGMNTWLHTVFDARVFAVRKVDGYVILKCDALSTYLSSTFPNIEAVRFNVLFCNEAHSLRDALTGVSYVGNIFRQGDSTSSRVLHDWLFPTIPTPSTSSGSCLELDNHTWFDPHLNTEQKRTVATIAFSPSGKRRAPYLIAGPPGTGKTKTLVEMTLQILNHQQDVHVLLVAPSPSAADTIALRLSSHLPPKDMIRLNDRSRTFAEVPQSLMLYCIIDNVDTAAHFALPSWERLVTAKVVVVTTTDVHMLVKSKVSNVEFGRWQAKVLAPLIRSIDAPKAHWTHLIVDEAAQATEAEIINSLLTILPSPYHNQGNLPTVVLCGDPSQLGPSVQSHFARSYALDMSLLERLSRRRDYRSSFAELRRQGRLALVRCDFGPGSLGDTSPNAALYQEASHLVRNYRARQASLLQVVSMLFYDDALLPCAPKPNLDLSSWSELPNHRLPLIFEHMVASDEWVDEGASFYNEGEIQRVVKLCRSLTDRTAKPFAAATDIAVITPYREQVWRIRMALRNVGLSSVSVGNVEVYQGLEHRISIISTVRSSRSFLAVDAKRGMGLVFERKRLCVAISRAMEALIIVGNANLLKVDPYWRTLIAHAKRNGVFRGSEKGNDDVQSLQIGALEYMERAKNSSSVSSTVEEGEILAGRIAETTLLEEEE